MKTDEAKRLQKKLITMNIMKGMNQIQAERHADSSINKVLDAVIDMSDGAKIDSDYPLHSDFYRGAEAMAKEIFNAINKLRP
mgnify:CR=1 FL=1